MHCFQKSIWLCKMLSMQNKYDSAQTQIANTVIIQLLFNIIASKAKWLCCPRIQVVSMRRKHTFWPFSVRILWRRITLSVDSSVIHSSAIPQLLLKCDTRHSARGNLRPRELLFEQKTARGRCWPIETWDNALIMADKHRESSSLWV